jgi:hypothetical protein
LIFLSCDNPPADARANDNKKVFIPSRKMPHPLIHTAYAAFNSRDIDTALTTMHPDVRWPKAFEGDFVIVPIQAPQRRFISSQNYFSKY